MTSSVPHQALYRRWRAQTFAQIVGQEAVVETLRNAVRTDRVAHALLFVGPRGTGKTSLARIVAKALNCTDLRDGDPCDACDACVAIREGTTLDVLEIDAASNRGINEVRELRERLAYPPGHLRRKVYILDEAHQITKDAWNALLKSLEEPPPFVVFMFASTEPSLFPPAILSRLQRYDVRRLTVTEIEGKLARILEAEGRTATPEALRLVARLAAGGMRDAESMLDQVIATAPDVIDEARVRDLLGLADAAAVSGFIDALARGDAAAGFAILDDLDERGRDPRALLDQVVDLIRMRLVADATGRGSADPQALTAVARRLVAIDPDRTTIGGLRLQLELALLAGPALSRPPGAAPAPAPALPTSTPTPTRAPAPTASASADELAPAATATPTPAKPAAAPKGRPARPAPVATEPAPAVAPVSDAAPTHAPAAGPTPMATSAEPAPAAAPPDGPVDLGRILAAWPDVVASLSRQPAIKQLILACRPIEVDGAVITLGYPEEQAFLRDAAERQHVRIAAGIAEVLGHDVGVRCVVANVEVPAPPDTDTDDLLAEARRIFGDDLVDVEEVR
ncbi:MAG: DNA polymerase III subunit gamma/tau [Candidatus Limnocylindria bacterium]